MRYGGEGVWQISRAPRRAGGLALQPLTLLLKGQLALGLNVLQCGCKVARKAACAILDEWSILWREMEHWDQKSEDPRCKAFRGGFGFWLLPSRAVSNYTTTTTLLHTSPSTVLRPLGMGYGPR